MADGYLEDGAVLELDEGGEEAVHAGEEGEALGVVGTDDLEGATGVGDAVVGEGAADGVGDAGGEVFDEGVLAAGTDAEDELVAVDVGEEEVEVGGGGLEVGVDVADPGGLGVVDTGLEGGGEAAVGGEVEVVEVGLAGAGFADEAGAVVGGAVVDEEDAGGEEGGGEEGGEFVLEAGDVAFFVVDWYYDG